MDILTSVHLGKRLHSQTCMLHFSAKHHNSRGTHPEHPDDYCQAGTSSNQLESAQNPNPTFRTDPANTSAVAVGVLVGSAAVTALSRLGREALRHHRRHRHRRLRRRCRRLQRRPGAGVGRRNSVGRADGRCTHQRARSWRCGRTAGGAKKPSPRCIAQRWGGPHFLLLCRCTLGTPPRDVAAADVADFASDSGNFSIRGGCVRGGGDRLMGAAHLGGWRVAQIVRLGWRRPADGRSFL